MCFGREDAKRGVCDVVWWRRATGWVEGGSTPTWVEGGSTPTTHRGLSRGRVDAGGFERERGWGGGAVSQCAPKRTVQPFRNVLPSETCRLKKGLVHLPYVGPKVRAELAQQEIEKQDKLKQEQGPSAVDRIEVPLL